MQSHFLLEMSFVKTGRRIKAGVSRDNHVHPYQYAFWIRTSTDTALYQVEDTLKNKKVVLDVSRYRRVFDNIHFDTITRSLRLREVKKTCLVWVTKVSYCLPYCGAQLWRSCSDPLGTHRERERDEWEGGGREWVCKSPKCVIAILVPTKLPLQHSLTTKIRRGLDI